MKSVSNEWFRNAEICHHQHPICRAGRVWARRPRNSWRAATRTPLPTPLGSWNGDGHWTTTWLTTTVRWRPSWATKWPDWRAVSRWAESEAFSNWAAKREVRDDPWRSWPPSTYQRRSWHQSDTVVTQKPDAERQFRPDGGAGEHREGRRASSGRWRPALSWLPDCNSHRAPWTSPLVAPCAPVDTHIQPLAAGRRRTSDRLPATLTTIADVYPSCAGSGTKPKPITTLINPFPFHLHISLNHNLRIWLLKQLNNWWW